MAVDYPAGMPLPERADYSLNPVSPLMRSKLLSGRARQRRRFTNTPVIIPLQWIYTNGQALIFESWFQNKVKDGASWINLPLETTLGIGDYESRFTGIYSIPERIGVSHWRVTAEVELRKRQTIPAGWLGMPDFILNMDRFDIAMNVTWPEA